jgi:ribosomal protein S18 acetylase RimI-like enzyme
MIEIKKAEINDLPVVQHLAQEIWPAAYSSIIGAGQLKYMLDLIYSVSSLEHQYTVLMHQFILVLENKIPIGFASYSPHEDTSVYHLNKIYVLPGQQGKSIGKKILSYITEEIRKTDATSVQLNVNRNNKALLFYQKQGFKIISKEDIDIGEGYFMNDYVMELKF